MRLKRLTDFVREHTVEPRPRPRTVQKWPGARKVGGVWYIDMDVWAVVTGVEQLAAQLEKKPAVARLVG